MKTQRERVMRYVETEYGSEPEYLWEKYPDYAVCRHPGSRKWFAVFMRVQAEKLGLTGAARVEIMDIKCSPVMIGALLTQKGYLPAYHMNKDGWITVVLDDTVADDEILPLLEFSYDSVAPKGKRRASGDDSKEASQ